MLKIIRLPKSSLKMTPTDLKDGLEVLKSTGAIASYQIRRNEIALTLDHVRAEMVLEHLVGIEPPSSQNRPKDKRGNGV